MFRHCIYFQLCTYITPACRVYAYGYLSFSSVSVLAGLRQGGSMLVVCAIFSHHCGFFLSQTWLRDPVGVSRATSPSNDVTRFLSERGSSQLVSEPSSTLGNDEIRTHL